MKTRQKTAIFIIFLATCVAIALLAGSLATNYWIVSAAYRPSNQRSIGTVNLGLFRGTRRLNTGFGERVHEMNVVQVQYEEKDFFVRELYVTTISCVCAAILFGLICAALSLYNTASNPVEAVCHFPGTCITFIMSLDECKSIQGSDHIKA
jgi:hypothetical protein